MKTEKPNTKAEDTLNSLEGIRKSFLMNFVSENND